MTSPVPPSSLPLPLDGLAWRASAVGIREAEIGTHEPFEVVAVLRALDPFRAFATQERDGAWYVVELPPDEPPKISESRAATYALDVHLSNSEYSCSAFPLHIYGPSAEYVENYYSRLSAITNGGLFWCTYSEAEKVSFEPANHSNDTAVVTAVGVVMRELRKYHPAVKWPTNTELSKVLAEFFAGVNGHE